jgi:ATP-dependent DNA ligase
MKGLLWSYEAIRSYSPHYTIATVRFAEWTADGLLRFPVFEALRPDVPPASCRLEAARPPP